MNARTATFWLPALISLAAAMGCLTISTFVGMQLRFVARGLAAPIAYFPWLLMLPLCGAAGAYFSGKRGGRPLVRVAAGLFPVIAMSTLVLFLVLTGKFVFAQPHWVYLSSAILLGVLLPSIALLSGTLPYACVSRQPASSNS